MITSTKETKAQASLLDLLGGSGKKEGRANDVFSQLLASLQGKADVKSSARGKGLEALLNVQKGDASAETAASDPKIGRIVSGLLHTLKGSESKPAEPASSALSRELRSLLGGEDRAAAETLVARELLSTLSADQVKTLIHRAKEYLKNEIATQHPEYLKDEKTLPKTLMGLVQLAEKLDLKPASITLEMLLPDPAEQQPFPQPLLSKPLMEAKSVAQLPTMPEESGNFEAIRELLGAARTPAQTDEGTAVFSKNPDEPTVQPLQSLLQSLHKQGSAPLAAATATEPPPPDIQPTQTKAAEPKHAASPYGGSELLTLLHGEASSAKRPEDGEAPKAELHAERALHAPKADAIEVKAKEAQQSMRLFATELKEAVDNYKPPFTRITMKLNPEKLGDVEVTLVQRGNNVHVNIQSSNANSIAFLAHNATELKAQLAHQGITNATMNFMAGGDGQMPQNQQQQQHNRFRAYTSFEELDMNDEALSALELIIPQYA